MPANSAGPAHPAYRAAPPARRDEAVDAALRPEAAELTALTLGRR